MSKPKVSFGHAVTFYFKDTLEDQQVRKCYWMTCALDRIRFKARIKQFEKIYKHKKIYLPV